MNSNKKMKKHEKNWKNLTFQGLSKVQCSKFQASIYTCQEGGKYQTNQGNTNNTNMRKIVEPTQEQQQGMD